MKERGVNLLHIAMRALAGALVFALLVSVACENPAEPPECERTITSCPGESCSYFYVFDSNGNFIAEGFGDANGSVNWDGTDCHGNPVACGEYTLRVIIKSNGQAQIVDTSIEPDADVCIIE
jgi:hypothetical protein